MNNLISSIKNIIINAGAIAKQRKQEGLQLQYKEDKSPVTNADREISDFIYNNLREIDPKNPIICEERPLFELNTNSFWLIDPIDGTRSYIKGKDTYTVNIGLIENGQPILGFIYLPEINKLYYTNKAGKLSVEQDGKILNPPPPCPEYTAVVSSHFLNIATRYFLTTNNINNVISMPSSIKLCLIADDSADVYPRFGQTMEWDIAAGHALIRASGGEVFDAEGMPLTYGKPRFEHPNFVACGSRWRRCSHGDE